MGVNQGGLPPSLLYTVEYRSCDDLLLVRDVGVGGLTFPGTAPGESDTNSFRAVSLGSVMAEAKQEESLVKKVVTVGCSRPTLPTHTCVSRPCPTS